MLFTHGSTAVSVRTLEVFCLHSVAWNSETALGLPHGCWGNTGLGSPLLPRLLGSPESWSYSFGGFFTLISVDISSFSAGSAFFFLIQIEGLWLPCIEHAYQCHVPHSIMFKLRSVHLKEKLMLLYI